MSVLFSRIFIAEFSYVFINPSDWSYTFLRGGRIYPFGHIPSMMNEILDATEKKENLACEQIERGVYCPKPLDVYLSMSMSDFIFMITCADKDILPSTDILSEKLKYFSGYSNNYGFHNLNNVADIMTKPLFISDSDYNRRLWEPFPFFKFLACNSLTVVEDELVISFSTEYEKIGTVIYEEGAFAKLLSTRRHLNHIPAPSDLKKIATDYVGEVSASPHENLYFASYNYMTYLWKDFNNICEEYGYRIEEGEKVEHIADEIMPTSRDDKENPITNLLHYIYHNSAFGSDLTYEDAWQGIYDEYREFVLRVLKSVSVEIMKKKT